MMALPNQNNPELVRRFIDRLNTGVPRPMNGDVAKQRRERSLRGANRPSPGSG